MQQFQSEQSVSKADRANRATLTKLNQALRRGGRGAALVAARVVSDPSREVRLRAFEALSEHGDSRWATLALVGLDDAEDTVAVAALECLVGLNARRSVEGVVPLLESASELTRTYAAWAIGKLGGPNHVPLLKRRLRRLGDEVESSALSEALFMLTREPKYLKRLLRQLKSTDPEARAFTTNSLVGLVDVNNFLPIICALAEALSTETSHAVLPSIRRDLIEIVSLAADWKFGAS